MLLKGNKICLECEARRLGYPSGREMLEDMYLTIGTNKMGKLFKVDHSTVTNWFRLAGISVKSHGGKGLRSYD